jgi:hypothetical protein
MSDTNELALTDADRNTAAWLKIRAHLQQRLDALRRMNDNELSVEKTATLRGKIQEIKELIAAGEAQDDHQ